MRLRGISSLAIAAMACAFVSPAQAQDDMRGNYENPNRMGEHWRGDDRPSMTRQQYVDRYVYEPKYGDWYYEDRSDDESLRRDLERRDVDHNRERQQFSSPTHRSATDEFNYNRYGDRRGRYDYDRDDYLSDRRDENDRDWSNRDAYRGKVYYEPMRHKVYYDPTGYREWYDRQVEDDLPSDMARRDTRHVEERFKGPGSNPALRGATDLRGQDRYDYYDYDRRYDGSYDAWERREARRRDFQQNDERDESWSNNPAQRSATDLNRQASRWYDDDRYDYDYDYDYRTNDYRESSDDMPRDTDQDAERHVFSSRTLRGATDLGQRDFDTDDKDMNDLNVPNR